MTTHRPTMRVEITRVLDPTGHPAVLVQADEWHLVLPPYGALELADSLAAVARGIIAERS